ncbi:MAG: 50S ribosomal protein L11 methyltransferase [Xanthobacteraceae bacterium]
MEETDAASAGSGEGDAVSSSRTWPGGSVVARLQIADEAAARRLIDQLCECWEPEELACSAHEAPGGWSVDVHFKAVPNETAVRALVALVAGEIVARALVFERIGAKDWVRESLEGLRPVAAGRFVVHGGHDRARVAQNRVGIEIEAALAFGTGHHGTTRGCLLALDRIAKGAAPRPPVALARNRRDRSGLRAIDVGTGTGVLAIAAAKALRARVLASDIDTRAVNAARGNARLNRVGGRIELIRANGVTDRLFRLRAPFDIGFANILLLPLKRLARPLARLLAPHGHLVLSGLLPSHANAAIAAYRAQGLRLERRLLLDGWVTLVLRRP